MLPHTNRLEVINFWKHHVGEDKIMALFINSSEDGDLLEGQGMIKFWDTNDCSKTYSRMRDFTDSYMTDRYGAKGSIKVKLSWGEMIIPGGLNHCREHQLYQGEHAADVLARSETQPWYNTQHVKELRLPALNDPWLWCKPGEEAELRERLNNEVDLSVIRPDSYAEYYTWASESRYYYYL